MSEKAATSTTSETKLAKFPNKVDIWYKSSKLTTAESYFYIGPNKDETPLYMASAHLGASGKSDLTIFHGLEKENNPLGVIQSKSTWSTDSIITLHDGSTTITEKLNAHMKLTKEKYDFAWQVGDQVEKFEWRMTNGDEIKEEGGYLGFKLVRLNSTAKEGSGAHVSSDGKEIVAVWADMKLNHIGTFELFGSAATGEFGDLFHLTAILTAMRIWQVRWYILSIAH